MSTPYDVITDRIIAKLEAGTVPWVKVLIEWIGVSAASRWIGDTPQVLLKHYLQPTTEAEHEALAAILDRIDPDKQQRNSNPTANLQNGGPLKETGDH